MMKLDMSRTFPRRAHYFPKVLKKALCRAVSISVFFGSIAWIRACWQTYEAIGEQSQM